MDTPELRIDLSALRGTSPTTLPDYTSAVYIYRLTYPDGRPFYVGSSVNPTSRLLTHLSGQCRDTAATISEMAALGDVPTMEVVDMTTRDHRLWAEARWINETPGVVNSTQYHGHYAQWQACPTCYRAASTGTLTTAIKPN